MSWHDLLFMHWQVPQEALRGLVPAALEIDQFEGRAWIGVIPFRMTGVRHRIIPSFLASDFHETNVRTYVRHNGRSGVWFFSLDAADRLAVWAARRFFHLPYHFASIGSSRFGELIDYRCQRNGSGDVRLICRYRPVGLPEQAMPGTLEHWLTERYCLFTANRHGKILRGDIHHQPWTLQPAEVEVEANTMTAPLNLSLPNERPLAHFARSLDVVSWSLE